MHEQSLIEAVLAAAGTGRRGGGRRAGLRPSLVRALSHFTPDHFREHFERAAAGTVAEGAEVEVELSEDVTHPDASGVKLESVEVEG